MDYSEFGVFDGITEALGLTPRDLILVVAACNGVMLPDQPTPDYLEIVMRDVAAGSFADHEKCGRDLGGIPDDTSETPYQYHDVAEKLGKLSPWQAIFLCAFVRGYWMGVSQVNDQIRGSVS